MHYQFVSNFTTQIFVYFGFVFVSLLESWVICATNLRNFAASVVRLLFSCTKYQKHQSTA